MKWLLAAAEQGLPLAQVKLAEAYAERPDIPGSYTTACGWFLLAAMGLRGIYLHGARTGYERIASRLSPAQQRTSTKRRRLPFDAFYDEVRDFLERSMASPVFL